jgi:hypothetical protein
MWNTMEHMYHAGEPYGPRRPIKNLVLSYYYFADPARQSPRSCENRQAGECYNSKSRKGGSARKRNN